MSKQFSVLKNIGEGNLLELLDDDLIELLSLLELTSFETGSLATLLLEIEGPKCVADISKIREKVFSGLSNSEAVELCDFLEIKPESSAWRALLSAKFKRGTKRYRALCEWLEILEEEQTDKTVSRPEKVRNSVPDYPLFPHQITAVNKAWELLSEKGRLLLHMPTGAGKTRTAMNLISDFLRKTINKQEIVVWLAHSEELCEQAAEEFEKAWSSLGNRKIEVVRHFKPYTNKNIQLNGDTFLVMSLQSAYSMAFSDQRQRDFFEISSKVGLTVIDEAHKATAETYSHVLNLLAPVGASKLLGLTATPGRTWLDRDEDKKLADFFLRTKVALEIEGYPNPVEYLRDKGYLARQETIKIKYDGSDIIKESALKFGDFTNEQLVLIGKDALRNIRIIDSIEAEIKNNGQIIVFACSVPHAKLLTAILLLRRHKVVCVTGDTKTNIREKNINDFKDQKVQIIINFGVLTTGFDAPKADVAVIARPTQSLVLYSQMVGRVIRGIEAGGTKSCRVVTVVDQHYGFKDLSQSFDFWDDIWE